MHTEILRGDILFADLDPAFGSEQGGTRPVLVIQNNIGNRFSATTIVAAITYREKPSLPTHVLIQNTPGLKDGSIVLLEQLRTIDEVRLSEKIGTLNEKQMHLVNLALFTSLGIHYKPQAPLFMTLCKTCAQSFLDSNSYALRQVSASQDAKDTCTICNVRTGYDFEVTRQ